MIYPGAVWNPGINAGYRAGRNTMTTAVCHYTVGRNSTGIGLQGYFHFLISRDGTIQQFCEADAVAWHAGDPWNSRGPGIEIEHYDEPTIFTPEQHEACGLLIAWLGIPQNFYDGPRVAAHTGFITHRSLLQSGDAHSDYWDQSDWDAMTAPTPPPVKDTTMRLFHDTATDLWWLATSNEMILCPSAHVWNLAVAGVPTGDLPTSTVQWLGEQLPLPASGAGAVSCLYKPAPTTFKAV